MSDCPETKSESRPQLERQKSKDLHVAFLNPVEQNDEKKKYLTAKFDQNEMNLIRKRVQLETWLLDKLNELCKDSNEDSSQFEIEVDKILEIEKDEDKRSYLLEKLESLKKVQNKEIDQFIDCFLEKLKIIVNS